jgi:hypothetical protein
MFWRLRQDVIADHSELDRKARIEDMNVFGAHDLQDVVGLVLCNSKNDLQRLIGEFQRVRRMMRTSVADAFGATDDGRTVDPKLANLVQQPFAYRLVAVLAVLLGIERQLIAVHHAPPGRASRVPPREVGHAMLQRASTLAGPLLYSF